MTPEEFIKEHSNLFRTGRYQEALDLTSRHLPEVRPALTGEHLVRLAEIMHVAQMAVDLEEWDGANRKAEAEAPASRSS